MGAVTSPRYLRPQSLSLQDAIVIAGQTANLQISHDVGLRSSYPGSGQVWFDLSGNGYDFNRGVDASATTDDPAFAGAAGALTAGEYWSFDGGDFLSYDSAAEAFMNGFHKAGAAFSMFAAIQFGADSPEQYVLGTGGGGASTGMYWRRNSGGHMRFGVFNAGSTVCDVAADSGPGAGAWHFLGLSVDEAAGAGGSFFWMDGAYVTVPASNTFNGSYSSPSSGGAAHALRYGENTSFALTNDSRMAMQACWSAVRTKAQFDALFALLRGRLGV